MTFKKRNSNSALDDGLPSFQKWQFEYSKFGRIPTYAQRLGEAASADNTLFPRTQWKLKARAKRYRDVLAPKDYVAQ